VLAGDRNFVYFFFSLSLLATGAGGVIAGVDVDNGSLVLIKGK
jgi:hypothetical protein